jgi:hypothetical protein
MKPHLSHHRPDVQSSDWKHVNSLLDLSTVDDSERSQSSTVPASLHGSPGPHTPLQQRTGYEIHKRAFQVAQIHRASLIDKYRQQLDCTERQIRKAEDAIRPKNLSKFPVRFITDRHVLEHVVAERNDLYLEAAEYVPQGFVPNLQSIHRLPPDTISHPRGDPRVFYWG